jgi:hypothetical protein
MEMKIKLLALVCLLSVAAAWLCRFTVRDIGFVDLQGPIYSLEVVPEMGGSVTAGELKKLNGLARTSNLKVVGPVVEDSAGKDGRAYVLKSTHRDGALLVYRAESKDGPGLKKSLHSQVRSILIDEALSTFAFIVVVESNDSERNAELQKLTSAAQVHLQKLAPQLPRPITHPVQVLRLPVAKREVEKVLLWCMQLENLKLDEAAIAVFYGRAKSVGAALTGERLTERALLSQLALIGQSCECDTDRDWAAEPSLPHDWTDEHRKASLAALGFQPDSPMVKSEVARILNQVGRERRIGMEKEDLFLGYGEFELNADGSSAQASIAEESSEVANTENVLLSTSSAGDGDWDFADDEPLIPDPDGEESPSALAAKISNYILLAVAAIAVGIAALVLIVRNRG